MNITEVTIQLPDEGDHPRLLAYCNIVLEGDFAVHDLKLVQGNSGVMLAMPSRWKKDRCPACHVPNELRHRHCCSCGRALPPVNEPWAQERVDTFHPLNNRARLWLQGEVERAYQAQLSREVASMSGG